MGHIVSALGNWMTDVFGMNFALPNDLQYNKTGLIFGSTLVRGSLDVLFLDEGTASNFRNYIRQCMVPALHLKRIKYETFLKSQNIEDFLNLGSSGILAYNYTDSNNKNSITLCKDQGALKKDIDTEIAKLNTEKLFKSLNIDTTSIEQYILGISKSNNEEILEQTLIANAISDTTQEYLAMTGANAGAMNYTATKDDMQRKNSGFLQWLQAGKYLPLLKIVIECIFYALFPIVILMTMLPNGFKIFKSYILILVALQMWSPLFAIINLIMTLEQKYRMSSIISTTGGIISLYNKQAIIDVASSIQTQAGVLAFFIPALSFKIVQGMQGFGEGMASGVMGSSQSSTGHIATEVSGGTLSYGNTAFKNNNYDNTSAHKYDTNETHFEGMRRTQDSSGVIMTETGSGITYDTTSNRSNTGVVGNFSESLTNNLQRQVAETKTNTENKLLARNESMTDFDKSFSKLTGETVKSGWDAKGSVEVKTSAGLKIFGNGATAEGVVSYAVNGGVSNDVAKQLGEKFNLMKNSQKSYNEALNSQISKEEHLSYVTSTGANITRELTDEMFNKMRTSGTNEQDIKNLSNNSAELSRELQDYAFSKFGIDKPKMLNKANRQMQNYSNKYENTSYDTDFDNKLKEATK